MKLRSLIAISAAATMIMLVVLMWFLPLNDDFSVDNPYWNGTSDISNDYSITPLVSFDELPEIPDNSALLLVPYTGLTTSELMLVKSFVTKGGSLILADDYGYGNRVLEHLGLEVRFSGQPLMDPLFNYKNQNLPSIYNFKTYGNTEESLSLTLNHATCLTNVIDSQVLALSSSFSYLDSNGNGQHDENEASGPFILISEHFIDAGKVIVIADPSIFINGMEEITENYGIIKQVAGIAAEKVFIDQLHLPYSNLHRSKNLLLDIHNFLVTPAGTTTLVIGVLAVFLIPIWHKKGEDNGQETNG